LVILILVLSPLAAQNSPAGGLPGGNVINRDVDTYMMVNYAPFLTYQSYFTFIQGSMSNFGFPGLSAGYATTTNGIFTNFYINTDGFSLDSSKQTIQTTSGTTDVYNKTGNLNLQFDTLVGSIDFGSVKLGLLFFDFGKDITETTDFKQTISTGFFTPSLSYGKNFINDDFSMLLASGTVRFRFPMYEDTTEVTTGGIKKTTTLAMQPDSPFIPMLQYPGLYPSSSKRLEIEPQIWYFFTPQLEPMVVISHIYLVNTLVLQFFPEEIRTVKTPGLPDDFTRQERSYIGNTLFGYYNRLYVINSRLSLAWRVNFSAGFFLNKEGSVRTMTGGTETVTDIEKEVLYLMASVAPRLAFSWQAVPATLAVNGSLMLNQLGPANSISWQQYRIKTTDKDEDTVTTRIENSFNPIKPYFGLGAAWNLSPHLVLESGITVLLTPFDLTGGPGKHLENISLGVVYKR